MALPPAVKTVRATFGAGSTQIKGVNLVARARFRPSQSVVWAATGTALLAAIEEVVSEPGEQAFVDMVNPAQDGFIDGNGNTVRDFGVRVTLSYHLDAKTTQPVGTPVEKLIKFAETDTEVDLETLIPVTSASGVVVSIPDSWGADVIAAQQAAIDALAAAELAATVLNSEGKIKDSAIPEYLTEPALTTQIEAEVAEAVSGLVPKPQVVVPGADRLAAGVATADRAHLPSRELLVVDSVHEWWAHPVARRVGRTTYGCGYGSNGEILAWDRPDRGAIDVAVIGDAGISGPGGDIDDHDAPVRWTADDGKFSVMFWTNHGDTDAIHARPSLDGTAQGFLNSPQTDVQIATGATISYTQAFLHSVVGDTYTFWVLTRSGPAWPIKVITVNRATGEIAGGTLYRLVTISGDQPYVSAVQQGRKLRIAVYVNPAYDVHAIWLFHLDMDTLMLTSPMDPALSKVITAGGYLEVTTSVPLVAETPTTATSRRLFYAHPTEDRVLYMEWARGNEDTAVYTEAILTGGTVLNRPLGIAGPRNGYTAAANYGPGACYSPDGSKIITLHNTPEGGEVHAHTSTESWVTRKTDYKLSRPIFATNDEVMWLAVDHYTDYFDFLMHQVSQVGFPVVEMLPAPVAPKHPLVAPTGSLWVVDPGWKSWAQPGWAAGVPAAVPNLADNSTITVAQSSVVGGVVERTAKGGLHVSSPKSATGNMSVSLSQQVARDAVVAALTAGHEVFMAEVYRITRDPDAAFAPTTATARFMGIINTGSGDIGNIRIGSDKVVRAYPTAGVLHEQTGTTLAATGLQVVAASMNPNSGLTPGTSTAMLVHHNAGAGSPMPSRITYMSVYEDLTVSGRTYAQVKALLDAEIATGRFGNDTWTAPA
jgi:hypothetical protein